MTGNQAYSAHQALTQMASDAAGPDGAEEQQWEEIDFYRSQHELLREVAPDLPAFEPTGPTKPELGWEQMSTEQAGTARALLTAQVAGADEWQSWEEADFYRQALVTLNQRFPED